MQFVVEKLEFTMKKTLFAILGTVLLAPCSGSSTSGQSLSVSGMKHYEIDLNMENFSFYFETVIVPSISFMDSTSISIYGVLNYALYENVNVTLNLHVEKDGDSISGAINEDIKYSLNLNASGCGEAVVTRDGLINNSFQVDVPLFYSCTKVWSVYNVTGRVIYNI